MGGSAHARKLLEALRRLREELRKQVLWYEAGESKRASLTWLKTRVSVDHTLAPRQGCARDGSLDHPVRIGIAKEVTESVGTASSAR